MDIYDTPDAHNTGFDLWVDPLGSSHSGGMTISLEILAPVNPVPTGIVVYSAASNNLSTLPIFWIDNITRSVIIKVIEATDTKRVKGIIRCLLSRVFNKQLSYRTGNRLLSQANRSIFKSASKETV